jgi:hypothetical protein
MARSPDRSIARLKGDRMAATLWNRWHIVDIASTFGHAAAILIGLVLMVIGLALGVTLVLLPVGLVVGLAGVLLVVGGIFAHPHRHA